MKDLKTIIAEAQNGNATFSLSSSDLDKILYSLAFTATWGDADMDAYKKLWNELAEGSKKDNGEKHHIVMFHGEIEGCTYQNGVEVGDGGTVMPLSVLDSMEADYIACGHIHGRMKVKGLKTPCWYSGSVPPKNFGETHCGGWIEITL